MSKKFIYIISTHPIQYFVPLYKKISLDPELDLMVYFCSDETVNGGIDKQFGVKVKWDIPLLDGYKFKFLKNNSWKPSINNGFFGLINLQLIFELWRSPKGLVLVNGWMNFTNLLAIIVSKFKGHLVSIRSESPFIHESSKSKFNQNLRKLIFKYLLFPSIDKFFYIGNQNKLFYKFYGVLESKLFFTPYSVDNDRFKEYFLEHQEEKDKIREKLGFDKTSRIVLYSGKYIDKKRPMDLLKAILNIENCIAIFVGDGHLRSCMEEFIKINRIEKKTKLIGFVNQTQMSQYYLISDIYVMCSEEGETWGLSTNEAMNFNLPIILYDSVGCSDNLLVDGKNGILVKKGDIENLTRAINYFGNDEEARKNAGIESGKIVKQFSYNKIIEGLKAAIQ